MSSTDSDQEYIEGTPLDRGDAMSILLSNSSGPFGDPSYSDIKFPVKKKDKKKKSTPNGPEAGEGKKTEDEIDTSKLDFKFVDQTWDHKRHNWSSKDVEQSEVVNAKSKKSRKPVLVIRRQFGIAEGQYESIKTYADIKSAALLDVLREVLKDVKSISLRGKHPSVRLELLYSFLSDFRAQHREPTDQESDGIKQLKQLIDFLEDWFQATTEEVTQLLEHGEITYDLLWALFKPNEPIYTNDHDSEQPRSFLFDFGEPQDRKGQKYFEIVCRSLHYDGSFFGEVQNFLKIPEFRGARKVTQLEVFPLSHHEQAAEIQKTLVERGRRSISLMGVVHCEFRGLAFYRSKGKAIKINVRGRTIIDAASFKEFNANYANIDADLDDPEFFARRFEERRRLTAQGSVKKKALQLEEVTDEEASLCAPTVQGFSLSKRMWAEFTISGIHDINWNDLPFDALVLPARKKDLLQALVQQTTAEPTDGSKPEQKAFDDFVEEKGQGLVVLLHGSPGVGKTLTAEAVSEYQRRPLYRVSAGDLDLDSHKLEMKLAEILDLATRWKAIVLLDEADVFVESRTLHNLHHNTLVSVFLRQLEYFQGVMILTTNRVQVFDDAIKSRIHLGVKYDDLNQKARAKVWATFIARADNTTKQGLKSTVTDKQIQELAQRPSNGRQIKNTVRIAHALAASKNKPLAYEDLTSALDANEDFDNEHRGIGLPPNAANSYL
ncbi:uncharacterized protein KY384_004419 [Bacidia gigantensis]|uniref:uncharacterized protein n=1 Tax=Bacidia gigantensis TaxID=2732470 RepID=UPI001D03EF96|nr:uncharacterized protein KY384_004419 [Bacidia gigantensis]KAG8531062.1 hypothetical protein KY384_004419 [Bacidia gigantensis]